MWAALCRSARSYVVTSASNTCIRVSGARAVTSGEHKMATEEGTIVIDELQYNCSTKCVNIPSSAASTVPKLHLYNSLTRKKVRVYDLVLVLGCSLHVHLVSGACVHLL